MRNNYPYFDKLKNRISEISADTEIYYLKICDVCVQLNFVGIRPTEIMLSELKFMLSGAPSGSADGQVYIWEDAIGELYPDADMIPEVTPETVYYQTEDYRLLLPYFSERLSVQDIRGHITYIIFERGRGYPEGYNKKPFANEIQWWCMDRYIMLHAACVGSNGHGALIIAPSGKGKSTLSLSCLVNGMEFIADDYLMVPENGELKAFRLFAAVSVTPDTAGFLPELKKEKVLMVDKAGKALIDLQNYNELFVQKMKIDCLLFPVVGAYENPEIISSRSPGSFVQAVGSTARQIRGGAMGDTFKKVFKRLKGLPLFEMHLTRNMKKNAECLKKFIEEYK